MAQLTNSREAAMRKPSSRVLTRAVLDRALCRNASRASTERMMAMLDGTSAGAGSASSAAPVSSRTADMAWDATHAAPASANRVQPRWAPPVVRRAAPRHATAVTAEPRARLARRAAWVTSGPPISLAAQAMWARTRPAAPATGHSSARTGPAGNRSRPHHPEPARAATRPGAAAARPGTAVGAFLCAMGWLSAGPAPFLMGMIRAYRPLRPLTRVRGRPRPERTWPRARDRSSARSRSRRAR